MPELPARPGIPATPGRDDVAGRPAKASPATWTTAEPAKEPVVTSPHRRAPARFSWVGVALLGAAAVVAFTVTLGVFLPAIGALGDAAAHDPGALPARIAVCGRDWTKDSLSRSFTRDEIATRTEAEPIVVPGGPSPSCPPEVATGGDPDGMATVVYVKVGDDAFVPYSLVGAP